MEGFALVHGPSVQACVQHNGGRTWVQAYHDRMRYMARFAYVEADINRESAVSAKQIVIIHPSQIIGPDPDAVKIHLQWNDELCPRTAEAFSAHGHKNRVAFLHQATVNSAHIPASIPHTFSLSVKSHRIGDDEETADSTGSMMDWGHQSNHRVMINRQETKSTTQGETVQPGAGYKRSGWRRHNNHGRLKQRQEVGDGFSKFSCPGNLCILSSFNSVENLFENNNDKLVDGAEFYTAINMSSIRRHILKAAALPTDPSRVVIGMPQPTQVILGPFHWFMINHLRTIVGEQKLDILMGEQTGIHLIVERAHLLQVFDDFVQRLNHAGHLMDMDNTYVEVYCNDARWKNLRDDATRRYNGEGDNEPAIVLEVQFVLSPTILTMDPNIEAIPDVRLTI